MKKDDSAALAAGHPLASPPKSDAAPHAAPLETWQIIRFGDSVEARLAHSYYRERGWPVDNHISELADDRIYAFMSGYRAANAEELRGALRELLHASPASGWERMNAINRARVALAKAEGR